MATLAEIQTAYLAINRTSLAQDAASAVLVSIEQGQTTLASYTSELIQNAASTSGAAVAISAFITGLVPTAQHLDELAAAGRQQVAWYKAMGTANPELGAFEAFGKGFAADPATGFATKYGALTDDDFIVSVYKDIFGKAPSDAAISNLEAQFAFFNSLYVNDAGLSRADAMLQAKGAVLGQIVGYAFVDPEFAGASNFDDRVGSFFTKAAAGQVSGYEASLAPLVAFVPPTGEAVAIDPVVVPTNPVVQVTTGDTFLGRPDINDEFKSSIASLNGTTITGDAADTDVLTLTTAGAVTINDGATGGTISNIKTLNLANGANTITYNSAAGFTTINGGTGDDTFIPNSALFPIVVNGGGGSDTLVFSIGSGGITLSPTDITNVERLQITTTATATVTLSPEASFTEVVSANSSLNTTIAGFGANVSRLGVSGLVGSGVVTFTPDASAVSGSSDAVTLSLTNNGSKTSSILVGLTPDSGSDYYETLDIVSAGTGNFIKLATSTLTPLAAVNISGSAPLSLVPNSSSDNIRVVPLFDASTATGAVTLGGSASTATLGAADQIVKLGSGDDTVYFGANLTSGDTVDGGVGRDSLSIGAALTSGTVSALNNVSNVEVLRFDVSTNSFTQDVSVLAGHGLTAVALSNTAATAVRFNNLPASGITTVDILSTMSGATLTLALANGSGSSDALTLRFANAGTGATTIGSLANITGLETLNIVSGGNGTVNTISSDSVAAQQVLTGSVPFTLTVPSASGLGVKLDASGFTARLTITGASTGNDTVVLGSGNDVVNLRTGTDTITLGPQGSNAPTGWDLIGVASGSTDTVRFVSNTAAGNGDATKYTNGAINAALIGSTTSVGTGNATGTVSNLTLSFSANDGDFSLANAVGTASTGLAKGSIAQGLAAGDTLVMQSVAQNDAAAAATTNLAVVKLTTATAFTTDIKGTFAAAMGTASVTGLAADANYLVELFDSTSSKTVVAVVNTGASGEGDTTLSAADFTASGMAVIVGVTGISIGSGISQWSAF